VKLTLKELAAAIGAELVGDAGTVIDSASSLEDARAGQVSFLSNPKYREQLETTKASAVVVAPGTSSDRVALLKSKDPYYSFAQAVVLLHGYRKHPHAGIHPKAHVDPSASVGEGSVLYPGVSVGPRARIGRDCILYPNVVIYEDCTLGDRVTVHANATIGVDGYGYATHKNDQGVPTHFKIPQIGTVVIEDDVEIGSNCAISRAALGSTVIGQGSKIDNLVAIGHGTKIGAHALLVAQVGIAGSVNVGHHVTMAGQVGVAGHLKIGDGVTIAAQSGVMADIPAQSTMIGAPAMPAAHARRVYYFFTQLPELADRIKKLEQQVGELGDEGGVEEGKG
jgi:UDP-3-O-[3-hydroxymyristoyl] glucosamine N-acyltransferase